MIREWLVSLAALLWVLGTDSTTGQEATATLRFEPSSAAVGEPVRVRLSVSHARDATLTLASLGLDDSWVVFDEGTRAFAPDAHGRVASTWVFEIASLEPGERRIENIPLQLGEARVAVDAATLSVKGVLGADEDSPRALSGLPEPDLDERGRSWPWYAGAALALCAIAIALWAWLRKRRPAPQVAAAPSRRLAVLESRPLDSAQDVQAAHFALTRLLREAADLRLGRDRSGLTDEEWRAAASAQFDAAGLDASERSALEQLLERAAAVKYGNERPTHWATREALASARSLAARLEPGTEAAA